MDARTVIRVLKTPVTLILLVVFVVWVTQWALAEVRKPIPKAPLPPCVVTDVGPDLSELGPELTELEDQISADPRMIEATEDWAACMDSSGFDFAATLRPSR